MKALTTAIYGKLSGSTLSTAIGGRLYKSEAPQNAQYPCVVFFVVTDYPEYPGGKTVEHVLVQFSVFSMAVGSTEVEDILGYLRSLYDDCTLSASGYSQIYCIRGNSQFLRDEVPTVNGTVGIWHYVQEYNIQIVK